MLKNLIIAALLCASLQAQITTASRARVQSSANATQLVNPVVEWNRTLLGIVRTPGAQPPTIHSTRSFAILHAALFDAVNNIVRDFTSYRVHLSGVSPQTSTTAAADQAAHDVLVSLYPAFQATLDTELQQDLAQIPDGKPKADGITVGRTVASQILSLRANDGSGVTPPPYKPTNAPGFYQLTPPDFTPADLTHWGDVTPFAIISARAFFPLPPPALTDKEFIQDFAEVKSIGEIGSKTRNAEQTVTGRFWSGKIQNYWNEIAQTAAIAHNLDLEQSARLFALLNFGLADSVISFFDAKYFYQLWRPVTAAEANDDPNWLPFTTKTAPDPSYPGAHSATSSAGAEVLRFYFGDNSTFDVTSEVLPGVTRHFTSFSAAAQEAGLSRIYAGQHYRFDHVAGLKLGQQVSSFVTHTVSLPR